MSTLAEARRRKSLTQRQLAEKLGVEHTLVSSWERGVHKPGPSDLEKLCKILEITWEEIEFIPGPEKPTNSREERMQQTQAYEESMGYVDSTWLRGGRYDIDPAFHEESST
ncbi:MAG TPA: helix-turn-helix transcriptional regulator [Dehalococcoidia bacterium]|nr:helix-turn-helix transcriptional regulator [Dehalococcoidia bacterium]